MAMCTTPFAVSTLNGRVLTIRTMSPAGNPRPANAREIRAHRRPFRRTEASIRRPPSLEAPAIHDLHRPERGVAHGPVKQADEAGVVDRVTDTEVELRWDVPAELVDIDKLAAVYMAARA